MPEDQKALLLSIVEEGGYPDFSPLYQRLGFEVVAVGSMRKALNSLKKKSPMVVVAEFNFQSDFRDRTSSLESLLATLQSRHPNTKVVVLYDKEHQKSFEQRLCSQWKIDAAIPFPIDLDRIKTVLQEMR